MQALPLPLLRDLLFVDALNEEKRMGTPIQMLPAAALVDPSTVASDAPGGRKDLNALTDWLAAACTTSSR